MTALLEVGGSVLALGVVALFALLVALDEYASRRLEEFYGRGDGDGDARAMCSAGSHTWRKTDRRLPRAIEECTTCPATRRVPTRKWSAAGR